MSKRMLVNAAQAGEVRVAIVDDKTLEDLNIAVAGTEQIKGNIYKARVMSVENSLQAAFIDYGAERNGFITLNDINKRYYSRRPRENTRGRESLRIQDAIKVGTEMLVQVYKEEIGQKGAAFTTDITLPGRYIVLMPFSGSGGISRKIQDDEARRELKDLVSKLDVPDEMGLIVRTAGMGRTHLELQHDFQNQMRLWDHIRAAYDEQQGPGLIYSEPDVVIRSVRDYFTDDIEEIVTDDPQVHEKVLAFFNHHMPDSAHKVKLYTGKMPIFSNFGLEKQLQNISIPKVILPSGGSIVINPTEALTSIDVNSGKSKNHRTQELMAFETNLEAAEEIARQLRLRDLGGLVVVDFIDMAELKHRFEVEKALRRAMKMDKARVEIGRISQFGMLEMSRQRVKGRLMSSTHQLCPLCEGSGFVMTTEIQGMTMLRRIQELAVSAPKDSRIRGRLPVQIALYLLNEKRAELADFEEQFGVRIEILPDATALGARDAIEVVGCEHHAEQTLMRRKDKLIRGRAVRKIHHAPVNGDDAEGWETSEEPVVAPKIVGYLPPEEFAQSPELVTEKVAEPEEPKEELPELELAAEDGESTARRRRRRRRRSGRQAAESLESVEMTSDEIAEADATDDEIPVENQSVEGNEEHRDGRRATGAEVANLPEKAATDLSASSEISRRTAHRLRERLLWDAASEPKESVEEAEIPLESTESKSQSARRRERRQRRAERLVAARQQEALNVSEAVTEEALPPQPDEIKEKSEEVSQSVQQRREERRSRRSRRARQAMQDAAPVLESVPVVEAPVTDAVEAPLEVQEIASPLPVEPQASQPDEIALAHRFRSAARRSVAKLRQSEAPVAESVIPEESQPAENKEEKADQQEEVPNVALRSAARLREALKEREIAQETAQKPAEPETADVKVAEPAENTAENEAPVSRSRSRRARQRKAAQEALEIQEKPAESAAAEAPAAEVKPAAEPEVKAEPEIKAEPEVKAEPVSQKSSRSRRARREAPATQTETSKEEKSVENQPVEVVLTEAPEAVKTKAPRARRTKAPEKQVVEADAQALPAEILVDAKVASENASQAPKAEKSQEAVEKKPVEGQPGVQEEARKAAPAASEAVKPESEAAVEAPQPKGRRRSRSGSKAKAEVQEAVDTSEVAPVASSEESAAAPVEATEIEAKPAKKRSSRKKAAAPAEAEKPEESAAPAEAEVTEKKPRRSRAKKPVEPESQES